jgi:uncharacterized membrane protein
MVATAADTPRKPKKRTQAKERRRKGARPAEPAHARATVARVMEAERRQGQPATWSEHASDRITAFAGSMLFVWLHVAWYGGWIAWNVTPMAFDPPPFSVLTLVVSLEAIFLSTFVLITQNRQSRRADERGMVDLEVNVIAEQELTKLFKLVADIHKHIGPSDEHDPEVDEMLKSIDVGELIQQTADENVEARP